MDDLALTRALEAYRDAVDPTVDAYQFVRSIRNHSGGADVARGFATAMLQRCYLNHPDVTDDLLEDVVETWWEYDESEDEPDLTLEEYITIQLDLVQERAAEFAASANNEAVKARMAEKFEAEAGALRRWLDGVGRTGALVLADVPGEVQDGKGTLRVPDRLTVRGRDATAPDTYSNALAAVNAMGVRPRFNQLTQQVEFGRAPDGVGPGWTSAMTETGLSLLRLAMSRRWQGNDYQPSKENVLEAVKAVAFMDRYEPVRDYLEGLFWDGTPRVRRLFGDYFGCEATGDGAERYVEEVSLRFMVGAVLRATDPGCKFDTLPVIRGPQGSGKSSGLRALFGDEWFSDAELPNLKDKDAPQLLHGVWCQELSEMTSTRKSEVDVLKAFTARQVDRYRPPYGRVVEDHPRRCVFVGTVNSGGYLLDDTGARRFWPLSQGAGTEVDLEGLRRDRDQLWAEAYGLAAAGERPVMDRPLWAVAGELQRDETTEDPWVDRLGPFLDERARDWERYALEGETVVDADGEEVPPPPGDRVHTRELYEALGLGSREQTKASAQRIKSAMEHGVGGWSHRRGVRIGGTVGAGFVRSG